ncbi:AsmA-like C-terminal region-containing protein [Candidatus Pelagibacter sp. Uisw_090]|uniref:AsmA-like C-terminal region-containing protein n=1 Tax=Candidatus Pelagibacter sp. Uisw_090 TaxID=3230993 RepID=UPI0039E914C5
MDIKKIEFSSKNNFSFNVGKNLKIDNFKVESIIDLNQLIFNQKNLKLKPYLPNYIGEIKLKEHKVIINYKNNKLDISGKGNIILQDKLDNLSYQIIKNNSNFSFNSLINLKNNSLLIEPLDYEKKEGLSSLISIKGNFKKDNKLRLDLISLKQKDNSISVEGLNFNKDFKIIGIEAFNINYKNNKKILNNLNLKKDNSNFIIEGESFDASRIINNIMDSDEESSHIFENLNSKINIRIKKTYIDEINYMNDLYGDISFNNNKINDLTIESTFPNQKKINLSIKINNNSETITKLFSAYPKPLIKRYDFIKGFEEGYLDFYSSKKGSVSNSVLIIDNFKVKEVPVFAKLLSLASLQGIADLLTGEGIRFTDFEMNFSNQKGLTTIEEMYAIGPAVSILMNGYIETRKLVSLRGTLVPATTINKSIASIPLLGKILIGDKAGEGVFGVSFKIKGPPKNLKTTVNPIKSLTPRFITRTLEKIKKN